jgi:hypothetical protein
MRTSFQFASSTWGRHAGNNTPRPWSDFSTFFADSAHARNTILYKNLKIPTPPQKNRILFSYNYS